MLLLQATDQTFCISVAIHGRYHQKLGAQWTVKKYWFQVKYFDGLVKKIEKKFASNEHKCDLSSSCSTTLLNHNYYWRQSWITKCDKLWGSFVQWTMRWNQRFHFICNDWHHYFHYFKIVKKVNNIDKKLISIYTPKYLFKNDNVAIVHNVFPSWILEKCLFIWPFWEKVASQILHLNGFFPLWTDATCLFKSPFWKQL